MKTLFSLRYGLTREIILGSPQDAEGERFQRRVVTLVTAGKNHYGKEVISDKFL